MNKWPILLWICFLQVSLALCQPTPVSEHFGIQQGLSNQQVLDIVHDQQGYTWIATELGLNRFASGQFKSYYQSEKMDGSAINSNEVNTLCHDEGKLYIGTRSNGLNVLDLKTNRFLYYLHDSSDTNSIATNDITDILKGKEQQLWLATYHRGLQRFDKKTKKFTRFNTETIPNFPENGIWSLEKDGKGLLYIGHVNKGMTVFNPMTGTLVNFNVDNTRGALPDNEVKALFRDKRDNIWIGTRRGLALYDPRTQSISQIHLNGGKKNSNEPFVYSIKEIDNEIWVGTESSKLFIINPSTRIQDTYSFRTLDLKRGNNASIQQITPDRFGNIWVAIYGSGVDFISHVQPFFQIFPPMDKSGKPSLSPLSPVVGIVQQRDRQTMLVTEGTGIIRLDAQGNLLKQLNDRSGLGDNFLFSCFSDQNNDLWLGPRQGGVVRYNSDNNNWQQIDLGERVTEVRAIIQTRDKQLWIAAKQGVFIYNVQTKKSKKLLINDPMLGDYAPRTLVEDSKGNVWIGTYGQGLYIYNAEQTLIKRLSGDDVLKSNTINHLYSDKNNNIWVATNEGIAVQEVGLPIGQLRILMPEGADAWHIINAISEDDSGSIWCSTKSGLIRYLPSENRFLLYDESFGIPVGGFVNGSVMKDSQGKLYFGMQDGLCYFKPSEIPLDLPSSPIFISRFSVFNSGETRPQEDKFPASTQKVVLRHNENSFRVELAVMDYGLHELVEFSYMLYGHDADWLFLANERNLDFRNVPHGSYELRVRTRMKNGTWSADYTQLFIEIKPPFYLSKLAWIVYASIIVIIIWVLLFLYIKKIRAEAELQMIAHKHLQDEKLYNERLNFYTNITHELRTPLTLILGPLDDLLLDTKLPSRQKVLVRTVQKSANRLFSLVNQLLEFRKVESQYKPLVLEEGYLGEMLSDLVQKYTELNTNKNLIFTAEVPEVDHRTLFDPEIIQHIIDNLLSNAYKHTKNGSIKLSLAYEVSGLSKYSIIKVQDTGDGIGQEHIEKIFDKFYQIPRAEGHGTGVGLAITKELVSIHGGKISVESELSSGTIFTVRLLTNSVKEETTKALPPHTDPEITKEDDRPPIILLVEDDPDLRNYLTDILGSRYEVLCAQDGDTGHALAKKHVPDLILSDVMMAGADGYTLLNKLKSERDTSHIPVVFLTAKDTDIDREKGYAMGVDSYLTKPTSAAVLFNRIENLLSKKKATYAEIFSKLAESSKVDSPKEDYIGQDPFPENAFVQDFVTIVRDHLQDDVLDAAKLAERMNMSQSTLYRKLKALTGKNINQLVRKVRLHRAAELLRSGQYNITEVSFMVGMNSAVYFRQCFKEEFGVLPSEFQKQESTQNIN